MQKHPSPAERAEFEAFARAATGKRKPIAPPKKVAPGAKPSPKSNAKGSAKGAFLNTTARWDKGG